MDAQQLIEEALALAYQYGARDGYNTACQTFLEMIRDEDIDGRDRGTVEGNLLIQRAREWAHDFVRQGG